MSLTLTLDLNWVFIFFFSFSWIFFHLEIFNLISQKIKLKSGKIWLTQNIKRNILIDKSQKSAFLWMKAWKWQFVVLDWWALRNIICQYLRFYHQNMKISSVSKNFPTRDAKNSRVGRKKLLRLESA